MEYDRVAVQYLKADCLAPESDYAAESLKCKVPREATAADIAQIEAEMAAKVKRNALTYCISAEIGSGPKAEKPPETPFELIPHKPKSEWLSQRQYNPVKFDERVAG